MTPEGENPAIIEVDTTEVAGRVVSIDPQKRRITIDDPDGKKRTLKLSRKVRNLDQFKPGDHLDMVVTDETAIELVK